jgi:hypothetical protein
MRACRVKGVADIPRCTERVPFADVALWEGELRGRLAPECTRGRYCEALIGDRAMLVMNMQSTRSTNVTENIDFGEPPEED